MGAGGSSPLASHTIGPNDSSASSLETAQSWPSLADPSMSLCSSESTLSPFSNLMPSMKEKKRKNLSSLATLRKRLGRRRRTSKSFDHSQVFREFLALWNARDIMQLVEEYDANCMLKELSLQAEIARPCASTCQHDLCELYDFKYCSDTILVFKGVHFPVHKAIVCVRCPLFRELLGKVNTYGAHVNVNLDIPGLRVELFNDLLRYLYSGELSGSYDPRNNAASYDVLLRISEHCGVPNALGHDLKHLLETGLYSDASLVFSPPSRENLNTLMFSKKCRACSDQSEYSCHRAILAARSPFFRNVIQRQQRRNAESDAFLNTNQRTKIVLDESIIPRRYARVLLHVMYRDSTDLMQLLNLSICKCSNESLSTVPSPAGSVSGGNSPLTNPSAVQTGIIVKEVMELYEIARFLELDSLVQSCEDLIIDALSMETLIMILKWSEQSHGSPWVKRQAMCFLREEYSAVAASPLLCQLDLSHLLDALKSDSLQASELEVLQSVIKWGENRLMRRMEDREPNIVSQTTHSLRRGMRKKDLNDTELCDIISDLMCHVRIGHVLPMDSDALTNAAKRGLISSLPPYMLGEDTAFKSRSICSWIRGRGTGHYVRPRYFTPYVEEAKAYLEERISDKREIITNRVSRQILQIPDTLYMVDKQSSLATVADVFHTSPDHYHLCISSSSSSSAACYEDMSDANAQTQLPILEERILLLMRQREQELKALALNHRALSFVPNRCEVLRLIHLRVVREFGLPDAASDVLHHNYSYRFEAHDDVASSRLSYVPSEVGSLSIPPPPRPLTNQCGSINAISSDKDPYSYASEMKLEIRSSAPRMATEPCLTHFDLESQFSSNESRHTLSDLMPDIAIATTGIDNLHLSRSTDLLSPPNLSLPKLDYDDRPRFV